MSKYYTPTIEEFHVGFEYEALVDYYKQEFEKFTIDDTDSLRSICSTWDRGEVEYWRVKYLDKEDIESLLFTLLSTELNIHTYKNEKILLIFNNSDHECRLYRIYKGNELRFKGTIRNKSELKTILKMVII